MTAEYILSTQAELTLAVAILLYTLGSNGYFIPVPVLGTVTGSGSTGIGLKTGTGTGTARTGTGHHWSH